MKTFYINQIGNITVHKFKNSKSARIIYQDYEQIKVTVPKAVTYQWTRAFINQKKDWIIQQNQRTKEDYLKLFESSEIKTRYHRIHFMIKDHLQMFYKINPFEYVFYMGNLENNLYQAIQNYHQIMHEILKSESTRFLPKRIHQIANKYNLKYNKLSIRNNTSRWGSCSSKNHIQLNIHLMKLPDELIDYVIKHELVHTIHKNHGPSFWDCLRDICPDMETHRKTLKNHRIATTS